MHRFYSIILLLLLGACAKGQISYGVQSASVNIGMFNTYNSYVAKATIDSLGFSNMSRSDFRLNTTAQVGFGLLAGAVNIYVDNFSSKGEASPIATSLILFGETTGSGIVWKRNGWIAPSIAWASIPLAHVIKHLFDMPDTLHPNTYASILYLSGFTLLVAAAGTGLGYIMSSVFSNAE